MGLKLQLQSPHYLQSSPYVQYLSPPAGIISSLHVSSALLCSFYLQIVACRVFFAISIRKFSNEKTDAAQALWTKGSVDQEVSRSRAASIKLRCGQRARVNGGRD